jgi:hypothetical protein
LKLSLLNQKHSSYDADLWRRYGLLYSGGNQFEKNKEEFLPISPGERDSGEKGTAKYRDRLTYAHLDPYVGTGIDYFVNQLFARDPMIEIQGANGKPSQSQEVYERFKEDVDTRGTDLTSLIKQIVVDALIYQTSWILLQLPRVERSSLGALNRAASESLRASRLEPCDVYDWEVDQDGQLLWVSTHSCLQSRQSIEQDRGKIVDEWRVYDQKQVRVFQHTRDCNADQIQLSVQLSMPEQSEAIMVDAYDHGFASVPLLCFKVPDGMWLMNRAAPAQLSHFRLSAGIEYLYKMNCFPQTVLKMDPFTEDPILGPGKAIRIGENDSLEFVSPSSAPFDSMRAARKEARDEIFRTLNLQIQSVDNSAGAMGRSVSSKFADAEIARVSLRSLGLLVRELFEQLLQMVAAGMGDTKAVVHIAGMDQFDTLDSRLLIENANAAASLHIGSETFQRELQVKIAESLLPELKQETKNQVRKEIEASQIEASQFEPQAPSEAAEESIVSIPTKQLPGAAN